MHRNVIPFAPRKCIMPRLNTVQSRGANGITQPQAVHEPASLESSPDDAQQTPSPGAPASATTAACPVRQSPTAPLGEFSDPRQARHLAGVLRDAPSKAGVFRRVYARQASPREAIRAQCLDCVGLDELAIRGCTSTACPLYYFRPYQPVPVSSHPAPFLP